MVCDYTYNRIPSDSELFYRIVSSIRNLILDKNLHLYVPTSLQLVANINFKIFVEFGH